MSDLESQILPPVEAELAGKSWSELYQLSDLYLSQAAKICLKAPSPTPPEVHQEIRTLFSKSEAVRYQAEILRAVEILDTPDPPPADRRFAARVAWAVKVNKRLQSRLPTHPSERARLSQSEENNPLPSPEDIANFKHRYMAIFTKTAWEILKEFPDPEGIVVSPSQFGHSEVPEG